MAVKKQSHKEKDITDIWDGNLLEDGELISDGKLLFALSCVTSENLGRAEELMTNRRKLKRDLYSQDRGWKLLAFHESTNSIIAKVKSVNRNYVRLSYLVKKKEYTVKVNYQYWNLATFLTKFDRIVVTAPDKPVALYNGNDIAAVLAPVAN